MRIVHFVNLNTKKYIHFVTPETWTLIESLLVSVSFDSVNKQGQEEDCLIAGTFTYRSIFILLV